MAKLCVKHNEEMFLCNWSRFLCFVRLSLIFFQIFPISCNTLKSHKLFFHSLAFFRINSKGVSYITKQFPKITRSSHFSCPSPPCNCKHTQRNNNNQNMKLKWANLKLLFKRFGSKKNSHIAVSKLRKIIFLPVCGLILSQQISPSGSFKILQNCVFAPGSKMG